MNSSLPSHFDREPRELWQIFYEITQIPRPSKREEKMKEYIKAQAGKHGLSYAEDSANNIIVYVPATPGFEQKPTLIIQNHMDMVCDTLKDHQHNFERDPLDTFEIDGWIKARGTTLGADNGLGCAAALALALSPNIEHPKLELLFTSDEETGLNGAQQLDGSLLSGNTLINLDSEDWGCAYIGCAGGVDHELTKSDDLTCNSIIDPNEAIKIDLQFCGLMGGHSGCEIHLERASAIRLLASFLISLNSNNTYFELISFEGGRAHNIIPREAKASLLLASKKLELFKAQLREFVDKTLSSLSKDDQAFEVVMDQQAYLEVSTKSEVLKQEETNSFLAALMGITHGPMAFDWSFDEVFVRYSANLAKAIYQDGEIYMQVSSRFTKEHDSHLMIPNLQAISKAYNYQLRSGTSYPAWEADLSSKLLAQVKNIYSTHFQESLLIKSIHAGLECGIICERLGGNIDAISIGPTILGAHSPDERIEISTVEKFWNFLTIIIKELN